MSAVNDAREVLGNRLREIRKDARLTARELAALAGWHFTKVSKIEHGRTMPSEEDLELWCFHCQSQSELPDLIATARNIQKMYAEIRRLMRTGTARYQRELLEEYSRSHRFRTFEISLFPGVLQTPAYATVVLTEAAKMLGHPADIAETVDARMKRAQLMYSGDRLYHIVLWENVLRAGIAPPDVMKEQLQHVLTALSLSRVRVGIIPARARLYMPMCGFVIVDDRYVEVETFSAIVKVTQPREIAVYAKVFDHYSRQAVYGRQARALITAAMEEFAQTS